MRNFRRYTVEQFLSTVRVLGSSFSRDEDSILFTSNKTGIPNVYMVSICENKARQLTFSTTEPTYALSYFPNDTRILFSRDQGGNEDNHIFLLDPDGKEKDLIPGTGIKCQFLGWSHDDQSFYYQTNRRDSRFLDVYKMNIGSFEPITLFRDDFGYQFGCISADERYIAFYKPINRANLDIYLYDLKTEEIKNLTQNTGDIYNIPASFDLHSRYLYYVTDENSEFWYLVRYEITTGNIELVDACDCDIAHIDFSHNGRYSIEWINADCRTKIKIFDHDSGEPVSLPCFPEGNITAVKLSKSERLMAFYVDSDRTASSLYVYNFTTHETRKLIDGLNPAIDKDDLVEPYLVKFKSFDGLEIPNLFWKPHQASASNKVPALVWVHGGPGGQMRRGYNGFIQYLVNNGYAILGVNYRGSMGYGKSFLAADDRKHGREPLWDCIEAKNYLASQEFVDRRKIGIIGGSYGGYMVLAALAFNSDVFEVGVDLFGISNWIRMLNSFPPYWQAFLEGWYKKVGDPATDRDMLTAISPLFHADKIIKPLMVLQGANDPRVIKAESDDLVEAVRKHGGIVEYMVFADEGHGFTKTENKLKAYRAILQFFDRYLMSGLRR